MLSQISKKAMINLTNQQIKSISSINSMAYELLNRDDPQNQNFKIATHNPALPLEGKKHIIENADNQYQISTLSNGIRVLTESKGVPNKVDLGILIDVGIQDETNESSGSLQSIQNTYLKTVFNTNETVNYGMVQMSGGTFEMEYDQENTYFKADCLQHDVVDIFNMVSDCALEPRSVVAASVGQEKNKNSHSFNTTMGEEFGQNIFKIAYNNTGLGMPLSGYKGNIGNLNAYELQKFQLQNITPNRIIVSGAGIQEHDEFLELVNSKLSYIQPVNAQTTQRKKQIYQGGEIRVLTEANNINVALVFEGVGFTNPNMYALRVAQQILNTSVINQQVLNKHAFIDNMVSINSNFSESGLFGLRLSGGSNAADQITSVGVQAIQSLVRDISADALNQAKNSLVNNVLIAMERQSDRLEEATKNVKYHGKVVLNDYASNIQQVTAKQVQQAVASVLKSNLTLVAQGGQVNQIQSYDKITNQIRA